MTNDRMQQLEMQQRKVIELESALSWVKACATGDAEIGMKERTNIRDLNARPAYFSLVECVGRDTYVLILKTIEQEIKERLDIERKIFEEM